MSDCAARPGERVKIEISGHQFYQAITGEIVAWGKSVETFASRDGVQNYEVLAVVIRTDKEYLMIPLKQNLKDVKCSIIKGEKP